MTEGQYQEQYGLLDEAPPDETLHVVVDDDIRFYKKVRVAGSRDVMVRIAGCNHSQWRFAHKADMAIKGIERLEGRSDWKTVMHCAACTGGGVWKVRWQ